MQMSVLRVGYNIHAVRLIQLVGQKCRSVCTTASLYSDFVEFEISPTAEQQLDVVWFLKYHLVQDFAVGLNCIATQHPFTLHVMAIVVQKSIRHQQQPRRGHLEHPSCALHIPNADRKVNKNGDIFSVVNTVPQVHETWSLKSESFTLPKCHLAYLQK